MEKYSRKEILSLSDAALDSAVKIQGTKFDRKRKLSTSTINKIKSLTEGGMTASKIAAKLGVSYASVRYNAMTDEERVAFNKARNGKHYGNASDVAERVAYKRSLVSVGAGVIIEK